MQQHPAASHDDLLVGMTTGDDAGVYSLGDGRALVQTVDIFTPVVDSPSDWGRIAAVNALSDIYAMGAVPLTALQYLAWPRDELPFDVASEVIEGGMDVMAEAGCTVVGGHSIDSPEPTFGFAVTGTVDEENLVSNQGAVPGDVLVLTKPIGIGIITTAIKRGICPENVERAAIDQMSRLNAAAGNALARHGASAATDVTGFGLLGHLREMAESSGVGATVDFDAVPVLDGTHDLLGQGAWAGGSQRNIAAVADVVESDRDTSEIRILADAQTSGGLLVAMSRDAVDGYVEDVSGAVVIGLITDQAGLRVT